jgi:hypothetical protein
MITHKFRLYPNKNQEQKLLENLDKCRFVYNKMLEGLNNNPAKRPEVKDKISKGVKNSWKDPIKRENRIQSLRKKLKTEEYRKRMSEIKRGFRPVIMIKQGQKLSEKHKKAISEGRLKLKERQGFLNSEEVRKKHSKWLKEKYKDTDFKKMMIEHSLKGLLKRPTSFEKRIINLINKYNLSYKYVGNGSFFIESINPDFIDLEKKIAIEVFFSLFKVRNYGSIENYISERRKIYERNNWKCIFIDENNLEKLEIEPLPIRASSVVESGSHFRDGDSSRRLYESED